MAAQSLVIACTSTPTVVAGSFGDPSQHGYIRVSLKSLSGTVYLGGSDVTSGGYPVTSAEAPQVVSVLTGETLYASSTGSASLAVLRTGETT